MAEQKQAPTGPDFTRGVRTADLGSEDKLLGHVGDEPVLLVRRADELFAVGALCTHYHGPLADGLVVGETVRCPWHHACFSLRTGEPVRAPAFDAVACWRVERDGERVVVQEKLPELKPRPRLEAARHPESVVIVGAGAAGFAAADMLRREGYGGPVTMISADRHAPYDRPNLSKDYLAGKAPEDWLPLRDADYYASQAVTLMLEARVTGIDTSDRQILLESGARQRYGALLLALGGDPIRLTVPGADTGRIHYLRSLDDSRAIAAALPSIRQVVIVGASFIGLEVAASLRLRNVDVHVVAPEVRPMEKILGPEVGDFIRTLHESHGVAFHLGETVAAVDGASVTLSGGATVHADLIVVGIGVRPALSCVTNTPIALDRGITVNEYLETNVPGVFAAGDIARWPDPHTGERIRVEHWVVAERQGQAAARNILGTRERFDAVPFFWSQHYDVTINYVGHAEQWDAIDRDGEIAAQDCTLSFRRGGRTLAVATIGRDLDSLRSELELEQATVPL